MILYVKSLSEYDPSDPHVLKYSGLIKNAIDGSSSLPEAQRKIESILEEAYTGKKNLDDPVRDIACQQLRSLDERLRRMSE